MESEKIEGTAESASDKGSSQASEKSSSTALSLHDCLSLGEIEAGLVSRKECLQVEEVQRLPYLLRLLSSTRPLASIQPFSVSKSDGGNDTQDAKDSNSSERDEYLDRIVDRLEDVAANYSVAGGIDVLTNHLGPSVAKNLSRLPPLSRKGVEGDASWNTDELAAVARDPIAKRKRRRSNMASSKKTKHETDEAQSENALGATSDEDDEPMDIVMDDTTEDRRAFFNRRDSMIVAAEDSQESTVIKTLSELASLVVSSLDNMSHIETEGDDEQQKSSLTLETDDILSEKAASGGLVTEGNDLSSTIVAIMHNAPVLRSRHVARALCRAAVPQTGDLISRLGANCPASVPSLLLGCIDAYAMSCEHHHKGENDGIANNNNNNSTNTNSAQFKLANLNCQVVTASKSAILALANLSQKESCRVQTKLQSLGIMTDMQLRLLLKEEEMNITPISCLLIEHLSFPSSMNSKKGAEEVTKSDDEQTPGDVNADSTQDKLVLDFAVANSTSGEPSLLLHFLLNEDLYRQTLDFFSHTMKQGASMLQKSVGKWCMILRALALLLMVPRSISEGVTNKSYKNCTRVFLEMIQKLDHANGSNEDRPEQSKMDTLVGLLSSCAILLLSQNFATDDGEGTPDDALDAMKTVFKILQSTSDQSDKLRFSLENELRNTWGIFKRVLHPLEQVSTIQEKYSNLSYKTKQIGLNGLCDAMRPVVLEEDANSEIEPDVSFDIPFRLSALRRKLDSPSDMLVEETQRFLSDIVNEEDEHKSLSLMSKVESAQFVVEATNFLVKPGSSEIPLVLPAKIDMAWSKIASNWKITDSKPTDGRGYIFLLRIMYAFIVLDKSPLSPFAFDPRSSPIKESLVMIQNISSASTRNYLLTEIQLLLRKHYPELIRFRFEEYLGLRETARFDTMDRKSILAALGSSIQARMRENKPKVSEGATEQLFLQAKARICDSDLYAAVTNAFLSSANAPSPTYSYYRMCRDPIVCLKFPLCVWECRSLRRIALSVLENLLISNKVITLKESSLNETALELLAARDTIVVRCLLAVLHGGDSKNITICSMTTTFIRWMIRNHPGLVAIMIKQGLQERDLDWLIENVPETMNDSRFLLQIFSERNGLTAAERLVAADAAIRVAIVHGQANEAEAGQLILTAVSQLVDSFYLILGPVGLLPVDALFTAESGTPITQISQKAAFRILKALTKLRGIKNHVRRDISIMLQKLVSLCKQELQGSVTGRRKQLIKEIYDAAVKLEK